MKTTPKINHYLDLGFIEIKDNKIVIKPEVVKLYSDYNFQEELIDGFYNHHKDFANKVKNIPILWNLFYLLVEDHIITTEESPEEFYYHSSLLDRIKNGALDDMMLRKSNAYNELLGSVFAIPIHINYDSKIVNYGIEKIEIPKRKTQIEMELDAEFARGILLYQALNDPLKESKEERLKHSSWAGHLTALKHYFKITDPNFKFTGDSLKQMIEEYEARETKEID